MPTYVRTSDGIASRSGHVARRGLWQLARIVSLVTTVVVSLIVIAIILVLLDANRDNQIVDWLIGAGDFLAEPFDNVFQPDGEKARIGVNWGLAAVVYAFVGGLIVRLLRR
jgi:hypothetical protein